MTTDDESDIELHVWEEISPESGVPTTLRMFIPEGTIFCIGGKPLFVPRVQDMASEMVKVQEALSDMMGIERPEGEVRNFEVHPGGAGSYDSDDPEDA